MATAELKNFIARDVANYQGRELAAYRAGLGSAVMICDEIARFAQASNRTQRGRISQVGEAIANCAKTCGDEIIAVRDAIQVK